LLSGAALQFVFLVASMVISFFLPSQYGMQPEWPSYLIAMSLLGIAAVGLYQIRTSRETQRIGLLLGLTLGTVSAILLFIPGLGVSLAWATFGLPMLIVVLVQGSATLASVSPLFALISTALYVVFATIYSICASQATRRSGSVKRGMQSSGVAIMATFLSTTLVFSFIYVITSLLLHKANGLVAPSSIPEVSPLMNFIASYQSAVQLTATWLLVPVVLGLFIALITALLSRHPTPRPAFVAAD
jgi:membrane-anchored protein YejM (alkaline phosphatase superfamily)